MTEETTNLVLVQLREIRGKLETFEARFDKMDGRFDKMDKDHELFRFQVTHTYGHAGMANTQAMRASDMADDALTLQKRMDERLHAVERSVRILEDAQKTK